MSIVDSNQPSLLERILAYSAISIIVVALASFFVTLIVGMNSREMLAGGLWQFVYAISLIALPVGFLLLILLLVLAQRRRGKAAKRQLKR